jgi:hypothetical protein
VLTPFARPAFDGPSPFFAVDANIRGAGKTLLAKAAHRILTGREMPAYPQAPNDEEEKKRLLAIGISGVQFVCIDNVDRPFGNGPFDLAMTSTTYADRLLGASEAFEVPMKAVWWVTGNNILFVGDTVRRCIHISIYTPDENPEQRQFDRDLEKWVQLHRAELAIAAVTILRAYCVAGRPQVAKSPMGSYTGWSDLVRQAVCWVDMDDPYATRGPLEATSDTEKTETIELIEAWERAFGSTPTTIAEALRCIEDDRADHFRHGAPRRFDDLRAALLSLDPNLKIRALGNRFAKRVGRVVNGKALQRGAENEDKTNTWFVGPVSR